MRYVKNRSHFSKKKKSSGKERMLFVGLALVVIAIVAFWLWQRGDGEEVVVDEEVFTVEEGQTLVEETIVIDVTQQDAWTQEVLLSDVEGSGGSGVARRGISGDLFTHVIVADLPVIETETTYYEGWLVIPGVVEFFSTGELFVREDGKWGLVWEANLLDTPDALVDYREVVVTRELRDGDVSPSPVHVLEGRFE